MIQLRRILPFAAAVLTLSGCQGREAPARRAETDRTPHLETVFAERSILPIHIELSAVIEPMEKADLAARVAGVIETLQPDRGKPEVDIGRRVVAGEALVKLAVPELDADVVLKEALLEQSRRQRDQALETQKVAVKEMVEAREEEKRYEAELRRGQEKHNRTTKLVEGRSLSPELAEESRSFLEAAESALGGARAKIETKRARGAALETDLKVAEVKITVAQAELQRSQVLQSYATIRAPFDGIVTKRWVDRGATIKDPGTPVLTVMRLDAVRVLIDIPQVDVPLVNSTEQNPNPDGKGDVVVLRVPALSAAAHGGEFPGHITRLTSVLDGGTRTMRAEVHLDNKEGHLRPGMYGTATVVLEDQYKVLTVPSTAIIRRGPKANVFYVANPTGNPPRGPIRRAEVVLGRDDGRRVEIRNGLHGDELIVAKGNGVLRDGDTVIAVPAQEP